jgi:hypothetical protein
MWGEKKRLRAMVANLSEKLEAEQRRSFRYVQLIADLEIQLAAAETTIAKVRSAMSEVPLVEAQS